MFVIPTAGLPVTPNRWGRAPAATPTRTSIYRTPARTGPRLVKRLRSKRPRRRLLRDVPPLVDGSPTRPAVVHNHYYAAPSAKKTLIPRQLTIPKPHKIVQHFRPSAANLVLSPGQSGSYNATKGLLAGPNAFFKAPQFFTLKFTISDLSQVSTFSAIFDAYRIDHVEVEFNPIQNFIGDVPLEATTSGDITEYLVTVIDYDDSAPVGSEQNFEEYDTYKRTIGYEKHVRSLTPAIAANAYKTSGLTVGYVQEREKWIDFQYTDVEHYGIKGCIMGTSWGGHENYRIGYYVRCKMCLTLMQVK